MKKLLLFFVIFLLLTFNFALFTSPTYAADVQTGVQLNSDNTVKRLIPSQYGFQWIKYQYQLGTPMDALQAKIASTKTYKRGSSNEPYKVLISVAKNGIGIEPLKNPPTYPPEQSPDWYTHQYCPWDNELETYYIPCGVDAYGRAKTCPKTAQPKSNNGYIKFRDAMKDLAPKLLQADAVEIWNEPNIKDEWSAPDSPYTTLGPISPENYVNFMKCGIKGLRAGGYNGPFISAGLASSAFTDPAGNSMNDLEFFKKFVDAGGLSPTLDKTNNIGVNGIGWHADITQNIPPEITAKENPNGFQRVIEILNLTQGKPIWMTEFGWNREALNDKGNPEEAKQRQAEYVTRAYDVTDNVLNKLPVGANIQTMIVWNFGFSKDAPEKPLFVGWDIEGTTPEGMLCQPNDTQETKFPPGNYVQDTTLQNEALINDIGTKAMIANEVNQDVINKAGKIKETRIDVSEGFVNDVWSLLNAVNIFLANFQCVSTNTLANVPIVGGFFPSKICDPHISIGLKETPPQDGSAVPGKNTAFLSETANVLGKSGLPENIILVPEKRDCNLGTIKTTDEGDKRVDTTSYSLGTAGGYYGNDIPDFQTINPVEYETAMNSRMKSQNLNIAEKGFIQDRRSPDLCLRLRLMIQGYYPESVFPKDVTCDDIYNMLLKINKNGSVPI
jgi:hypothetical protein